MSAKWARSYCREHYRPMPPRPDVACVPPWDLPQPGQPPDPGALLAAWAERQVPGPNRSEEQARRWQHADLPTLSGAALRREWAKATVALALLPDRDPGIEWLAERLQRVGAEMARRRRKGAKCDD